MRNFLFECLAITLKKSQKNLQKQKSFLHWRKHH